MTNRTVTLAAIVLAVVTLAGCESTEQQSAKIAKRLGHQSAGVTITQVGAANDNVRVDQRQLVQSSSGTAAALELTNKSARAQVDIPILITVYDHAGKSVYSNDDAGAGAPSDELSLLPPHATVWWVDPNVLASAGSAMSISAKIGAPTTSTPAPAAVLAASHLHSGSSYVGPFVGGKVLNRSPSAQTDVTIYAVELAGGHVVAAGQSLVASLAAHASASFQVSLIGSAKGAKPAATVAPTHVG
jgi:outer membrane murein-binding lipoprotein Lpp